MNVAASTKPERRKTKRRKTAHLKLVPETLAQRESLRELCQATAARLDRDDPLTKDMMEVVARQVLKQAGMDEGYLGWAMVGITSAYYADQVAVIPPERRLLLLPHCLKHAEGCPADYDEFGLDCERCGACSIADFRGIAEKMGYRVLVAEGSPIVMKIIVGGYVDAIVGVACLNVLEKAIDKLLLAGIPCMAVPLLSSDCRNTSVDESWVHQMITLKKTTPVKPSRTYVHLLRAAEKMFTPGELSALASPDRIDGTAIGFREPEELLKDPIAATESIVYDFLSRGGKHARPFITLAVHDALTGGKATEAGGAEHLEQLSPAIRRAALAIEAFHKASLVHDDVQDHDDHRYGAPTVHKQYGTATAINVGDYLIGMGYRLVSRDAKEMGAGVAADMLQKLATAHAQLCEGQGAELLWRDTGQRQLKPLDALKIYALKTSPAFEAALYLGARAAGPVDQLETPIKKFARNLGVGFQILNDLKDWQGDRDNKLLAGGDIFGGRPTLLWTLALEGLEEKDKTELLELADQAIATRDAHEEAARRSILHRVRKLYAKAHVFDTAEQLIQKHQQRAEDIVNQIEPPALRRLMQYLVDTALNRSDSNAPVIISDSIDVVPHA